MQLTAQNSEEQAMLDLMELRGFKVGPYRHEGVYILTPEGNAYAVQMFAHKTQIECAFAAFETLNPNYP
jgi:hypothetical protein